jgi:hypothetical protein
MRPHHRAVAAGADRGRVVNADDPRLSPESSGAGRLQRAVLKVLLAHRAAGELPTNGRFVFYELEGLGVVRKSRQGESRRGSSDDPREQEVIDALTVLRDREIVPWSWIDDETRTLDEWSYADSVAEFLREALDHARISPWPSEPPLILAESRTLRGPLRPVVARYLCPFAATNGQTRGFLHTEIVPILTGNDRPVLYLGDHDLQGGQIESHTRNVLERATGREIDWRRLAITDEQISDAGLTPIHKVDHRYRPARVHLAVEVESLGQGTVLQLLTEALDELLPEPLADVLERQRVQREAWAERLGEDE